MNKNLDYDAKVTKNLNSKSVRVIIYNRKGGHSCDVRTEQPK